MSNQEQTFENAVNELLLNCEEQEQEINEDTKIEEDEKAVFRVLLQGYRKALNDILEFCQEYETEKQ